MYSFISNFKALIMAALSIFIAETVIFVKAHPNFVERSNYLSWEFGQPELATDLFIYQKLNQVRWVDADIIQVGDSSGLHGVQPSIVDQFLGGLRFVNLSCCAPLGYDGYYTLSKIVLRKMKHPKVLVLYISLNGLPWTYLLHGLTRLPEAFSAFGSIFDPPSQSLRPQITSFVYTLNGAVAQRQDELAALEGGRYAEAARTDGWIPTDDASMVGEKRKQFFRTLCPTNGPGIMSLSQSLDDEPFRKMASLAQSYGMKFVIIFNPHPCAVWNEPTLAYMRVAMDKLRSSYPNTSAYPRQIFEHWPSYMFLGADHLRVGYERPNSARVGRFLADALSAPAQSVPRPSIDEVSAPPITDIGTPPVWDSGRASDEWQALGMTMKSEPSGAGTRVSETKTASEHYVKTLITGLAPGHYIVSLRFKPLGDRVVTLGVRVQARGSTGTTYCNAKAQATVRRNVYDGDMSFLDEGWVLCWASVEVPGSAIAFSVGTQAQTGPTNIVGSSFFPGDAEAGLIIRDVQLHHGWRPATAETGPADGSKPN